MFSITRPSSLVCIVLLMLSLLSGCATKHHEVDQLGEPIIFVKSLGEQVSMVFPLSDWGQTKTTLYNPEVEYSDSTGGIWIRVQGQTWNWNERRYRYTISMLTVPKIDTDNGVVTLSPTRDIIWDLDDVPKIYKQQVIDMTYPMLMDTIHDRGFSNVRYNRRPIYHE